MAKFELAAVKGKDGTPITIGDDVTGKVLEFDPKSNSKYIFVLNMGSLPADMIAKQMQAWAKHLEDLLGPGRSMVAARTSEQQPIEIYELQAVEE